VVVVVVVVVVLLVVVVVVVLVVVMVVSIELSAVLFLAVGPWMKSHQLLFRMVVALHVRLVILLALRTEKEAFDRATLEVEKEKAAALADVVSLQSRVKQFEKEAAESSQYAGELALKLERTERGRSGSVGDTTRSLSPPTSDVLGLKARVLQLEQELARARSNNDAGSASNLKERLAEAEREVGALRESVVNLKAQLEETRHVVGGDLQVRSGK